MNILILGGGGREHALAWAIEQNPKCDRLICAPGNAGIAEVAECADLNIMDGAEIAQFCTDESIDFVVIGPEAPLAAGVSDDLRNAGILTFGPSRAAAQLETSKAFTKEICDICGAPTAAWGRFTDAHSAKAHVREHGTPIVVKADGLAAGKGVVVAMSDAEAFAAIDDMFGGTYGASGAEVVIEEFLEGEEASFFVLTDGKSVLPLASAQDHKRLGDGDTGPNTGGMGAYSPAPIIDTGVTEETMNQIVHPIIAEMARRGMPYQGVLYFGLMIRDRQPRLIEINARFGDPECQVQCIRVGAQMLDVLLACAEGKLDGARLNWADDHAMTVVMAANGYPGNYAKGEAIGGLETSQGDPQVQIFHAGTRIESGKIVSNGGRVLNVTARGDDLREAHDRVYAAIERIDWNGGIYRRDIGRRALGKS